MLALRTTSVQRAYHWQTPSRDRLIKKLGVGRLRGGSYCARLQWSIENDRHIWRIIQLSICNRASTFISRILKNSLEGKCHGRSVYVCLFRPLSTIEINFFLRKFKLMLRINFRQRSNRYTRMSTLYSCNYRFFNA